MSTYTVTLDVPDLTEYEIDADTCDVEANTGHLILKSAGTTVARFSRWLVYERKDDEQ